MQPDLWKLKYFDFSEFIMSSRKGFFGRQWLYREMYEIIEKPGARGVLLIGNPGSGKTAFVCHLLCSATSSPFIHNRILGYHFCMHSDKGTQNAAKFVQNLANMIALRIVEYRNTILTNSFVNKVLQDKCEGEPDWCLQEGIITPLIKLQQQPKEPWYVVIDALDECAVEKAEILDMLKTKVPRFPVWLKLIISTRNISTITKGLQGMQRLELRQDDLRNVEDITNYTSDRIYPLESSIISKMKSYFSIKDNNTPSQRIVSNLVEKSQGNFLHVRLVLNALSATTDNTSWTENIPQTLDNLFQLYFERKFTTLNSFQPLRDIFEILVASYRPLSAQQIHSALQLDNPTLDYEYDVMPRLEEVSLFLWHGSRSGLVRIYHASLSEWLTRETNKGQLYYVKKENGHKRLAKYYLQKAKNSKKRLSPEESFYLTSHIVKGGSKEDQIHEFLSIPSSLVNATDKSRSTALHISARLASPDITKLLIKHFLDVDCLNNEYRTPAFVSASTGNLDNLIILSSKGAKLNYTVRCPDFMPSESSEDPVRECRRLACEYSLLHIASQEGNVDIVEFLIERHTNVLETTGCNNTAIQLAANNGHLEVLKTLKKAGGVLDGVSLHHAAAGGHVSVVDYLLKEGVTDNCLNGSYLLQDTTQDKSEKNTIMVDTDHLKMRETALHAAVRKEHLPVIEALLRQPDNALNCANAAGRLPLHDAVHFNNSKALQVMLVAGVNISVRCKASMADPRFFPRSTVTVLQKNSYPCGFAALHIAAMRGYRNVAKLLITHKADVNVRDCNGAAPLHIAACHGKDSLITLLVHSGAKINRRTYNFSTPLHSAAVCFSTNSFCTLLELGSNFFAKDGKNLTALYHIVQNMKTVGKEFYSDLYADKPINWIEELNNKQPWEKEDLQHTWLNTVIRITNTFTTNIGMRQYYDSDRLISETYSNVFHLLIQKSNASLLLTGSDRYDNTYLVFLASPAPFLIDIMEYNVLKSSGFAVVPDLLDSPVIKIFRKFTSFYPNKQDCLSLTSLINWNKVRSAYMFLKLGVKINCQDQAGSSPLLIYLHKGGRHTSKVLAKQQEKVNISCGIPFENSTLHLISYHKLHYLHYLSEFLRGDEEWSKYLASNDSLFDYFLDEYEEVRDHRGSSKVIRTGDGPLSLAIKDHPRGKKVINDCFDAKGYNALHRAAQGANVIALKRYLSWGANPSIKSAAGFSSLWLSVLYSVKYTPFLNFHHENIVTGLELDLASKSASVILKHLLQTGTVNIGCNENRPDLTLYHLAAIRGMWRFVRQLLSKKDIIGVDVNCPNKDGITPMYLAKLVGGVTCDWQSPWCKVVEIIETFGGTLLYPNLEVEYFLFFRLFFGVNPGNMAIELSEHEIATLQDDCERSECQEYRRGSYSSTMKSVLELSKAFGDYVIMVNECNSYLYSERCLPEVERDLPHFRSAKSTISEHQSLNAEHISFSTEFYLSMESKSILLQLHLLDVTRPYSRTQRTIYKNRWKMSKYEATEENKKRTQTNNYDQNSQQGGTTNNYSEKSNEEEPLETDRGSLRRSFLRFKESFNELLKLSKQTKSVMFAKGNFTRVLSRVNSALYNCYIASYCEWQENVAKYVKLQFQIWNLKFFTKYINENSRLVSITEFASTRIRNILTGSFKDIVQLVLRLVSNTKTDDFEYLTILNFWEPPLWNGTYDPWRI